MRRSTPMKIRLAVLTALAAAGLMGLATPARATEGNTDVKCPGVSGWYVNGDETDRKPATGPAGFEFTGADLVHHTSNVALDKIEPGSYALATGSDAPDQPSFFSVEVRDESTNAYGTLRWDPAAAEWFITIGAGGPPEGPADAGTHHGADPSALLIGRATKWGVFTEATRAISFGVGYTKNPAGTKTVVVRSVTFNGTTHSLECAPPTKPVTFPPTRPTITPPVVTPSATTRPTTAPVTTPPPATTPPATTPPATTPPATTAPVDPPVEGRPGGGSGGLPVTGPALGIIAGAALVLLGVGGLLIVATRRRKLDFKS